MTGGNLGRVGPGRGTGSRIVREQRGIGAGIGEWKVAHALTLARARGRGLFAGSAGAHTGAVTGWVDEVLAAEPSARRAPSVLNTQPVVLHRGEDSIGVGWDPARTLEVLDPEHDQLYLSLGAFIEALVLAAGEAGAGVRVRYSVDVGLHRFAVMRPGPVQRSQFGADELRNRVTGVGRFAEPFASVEEVEHLAVRAGLPAGVRVLAWERATGDPLAERAHRWLFGTVKARGELRDWLRPGADDGIELEALGLPAWRARLFLAAQGAFDEGTADLLGGHPRGLGTLAALVDTGAGGDPARMGPLGGALLRLGLQAIRHGLRLQPLPHVTACPDLRETLASLVQRAGLRGRVCCVFRVGTPQLEPPLGRRRPTPVRG